ncbi:MAG: hypothetical protein FWE88_07710 [Phycisphaerae bacterium]|nr:hypothetical protein [Phycisphaerae bacterium]
MISQEKPLTGTDQPQGTHNAGETPASRCTRREWFRQIARGAAAAALIGGAAWLGRHAGGNPAGANGRRTLAPCPPETLGYCASCSRRGDCALPGAMDFRARGGGQGGER